MPRSELEEDGGPGDDRELQGDVVGDDGDHARGHSGQVRAGGDDDVGQDGGGDGVEDDLTVGDLHTAAGDSLGNINTGSYNLLPGTGPLEADGDDHLLDLVPDIDRSQRLPTGVVEMKEQLRKELDHDALVHFPQPLNTSNSSIHPRNLFLQFSLFS